MKILCKDVITTVLRRETSLMKRPWCVILGSEIVRHLSGILKNVQQWSLVTIKVITQRNECRNSEGTGEHFDAPERRSLINPHSVITHWGILQILRWFLSGLNTKFQYPNMKYFFNIKVDQVEFSFVSKDLKSWLSNVVWNFRVNTILLFNKEFKRACSPWKFLTQDCLCESLLLQNGDMLFTSLPINMLCRQYRGIINSKVLPRGWQGSKWPNKFYIQWCHLAQSWYCYSRPWI